MVRNSVLRISVAIAVVLCAGVVVVATGSSATANSGDAVKAGQTTTATAETIVSNTIAGVDCSPGLASDGLRGCGHTGVSGVGTKYGVVGAGVVAPGGSGAVGVFGNSINGEGAIGVLGVSAGDGVEGDGLINGVFGRTGNDDGSGVYGQNDAQGFGVAGRSNNGTGVFADSANGTALQVTGRSQFSTAGIAVVASGKKKVTVTLAGVTSSDFVLATVQGAGAFSVTNAAAGTGKFTININKAAPAHATVTVAYFVISASSG